jgi:hypothetical protein
VAFQNIQHPLGVMAKIFPPEPPEHSPKSELKVRSSLSAVDDLVVLHSVAWQSRRNGKQSDGEADFVLLVPKRGILVLEVKGGGIEIADGSWYSTGRDNIRRPIKNPFDQAKDSKYALIAYLKEMDSSFTRIPVIHGVVFPDISIDGMLGLNAPRAIVLDRNDLATPLATLERMFMYWEKAYPLSGSEIDSLVACLAPTLRVRRLLCDEIADADQALMMLTVEQAKILHLLRRIRKAAILGGAGTGKTVLAAEKARQLSESGFRTLLLCYNAPLRLHLLGALKTSKVDVDTFHTLTVREVRRAKMKMPFEPSSAWYETEAPNLLKAAVGINGTRYDALLIDEAQDFAQEWLSSMQVLLANDDALLYLFADSHQDLYQRGWAIPDGLVEFELTINCRNTRPIAERVAGIFGDALEDRSIDGPDPRFIEVDRREQIASYVVRLVESLLLEERIAPSQMIVLTDAAAIVSELRTMGAAEYLFTTLEGHGIPVETIFRFKGLERDVVVLALTDKALSEDLRVLAYVGLSRAKTGLYVLGSHAIRTAIQWDG